MLDNTKVDANHHHIYLVAKKIDRPASPIAPRRGPGFPNAGRTELVAHAVIAPTCATTLYEENEEKVMAGV